MTKMTTLLGKIQSPKPPQANVISKPAVSQATRVATPPAPVAYRPDSKREERILILNRQPVNLIGFYEAVPARPEMNSGFTMQVNQAGLMVVGWISEVPSVVPNVTPVRTLPSLPVTERIGFIVFTASLRSSSIGMSSKTRDYLVPFSWQAYQRPTENINIFDSSMWGGANEPVLRSGILRLELELDPDDLKLGVRPKALTVEFKSWQITGINFAGSQDGPFDPVRLIRQKARLPYKVIQEVTLIPSDTRQVDAKTQNDVLRSALIASHVCIVPESYILRILRRATRLYIWGVAGTEPDLPPESESALNEWSNATTTDSKRIAREKVIDWLKVMAGEIARLPYPYHREIVRDLFIDNVRKVYKGEHTYYDLYVQILDEELQDHPNSADRALEPILKSGIFPNVSNGSQSFRYTITFESWGSLPSKLPINGGLATFDLKCEQIEFELDNNGNKKIDKISGSPIVKRIIKLVYNSATQSGTTKLTAYSIAFGFAPIALPPTTEIFSKMGDLKYEDFSAASFSFVWVQGTPKISIGPYAEIKSLTTGFVNLTLPRRNNLELLGTMTQLPSVESSIAKTAEEAHRNLTTTPKSFRDLRQRGELVKPFAQDIYEKGTETAAEGWLDNLLLKNIKSQFKQIVTVSVGQGYINSLVNIQTPTRNTFSPPKPIIEDTHVDANNKISDFFERDSNDISKIVQSIEFDKIIRLLTARDLIELFLALNLALIKNPNVQIEMVGYASPEGPIGPLPAGQYDPYNDVLSESRVYAVSYAVLDAMKIFPSNSWAAVEVDWKGESTARTPVPQGGGGLSDPPATSNVPAFMQWVKKHRSEVEQWPSWRRVDVSILGIAMLRLYD